VKVAVLGCGPAGMLVAHAVAMGGHDLDIYSKAVKSPIGGAQYLHHPISGLTEQNPDGIITFYHEGEPEGYARKIYGDAAAVTSWSQFDSGIHRIWNLREAYDNLWATYSRSIIDGGIYQEVLHDLFEKYDRVFSTIPRAAICRSKDHMFVKQTVYIDVNPDMIVPADCVIYSGVPETPWYRASNIFGVPGVEYPVSVGPGEGIIPVHKPLATNCDCFEDTGQFFAMGRYGEWRKGVLTSDAYLRAAGLLEGL